MKTLPTMLAALLLLLSAAGARAFMSDDGDRDRGVSAGVADARISSVVLRGVAGGRLKLDRGSLPLARGVVFYFRDGAVLRELTDLSGYEGKPATLRIRNGKVDWIVVGPREGSDVAP